MKKTPLEILTLIKKESGSKNNQELLEYIESLAEIMRGKKRKDVYLTQTRYRLKSGTDRFKDAPPEFDAIKD